MENTKIFAETEFQVEFYDVDSMDVVWHGNYIKYFEKARCALLDKIGYGYNEMKESGYVFPVTAIKVKYIKPLMFKQTVKAKAILEDYENRLRISYELRNAATGTVTTKGMSSQMAIKIDTMSTCFECPALFLERVRTAISKQESEPYVKK